ncbi:MAG: hypothetical protein ABSC06_23490 [Rhodopila sp.]|jgi:uncharacterized membrane protein YjfL (UPF0719 family)
MSAELDFICIMAGIAATMPVVIDRRPFLEAMQTWGAIGCIAAVVVYQALEIIGVS